MPVSIEAEFKANYNRFKIAARGSNGDIETALSVNDATFLSSYKLICAFRGWQEIGLTSLSEDVVGFFIEAHNDLLTSHVHATHGMWRSALISLRSFMESYLAFVYFKDHPVELAQWRNGDLRLEPKVLRQYCVKHPDLKRFAVVNSATQRLDSEYAKLSGSVHGSKVDFRMTSASTYPAIATSDLRRLRAWQKLQTQTVRTSLLIFFGLFASRLNGAAHPLFRKVVGANFPPGIRQAIKTQLNVNI